MSRIYKGYTLIKENGLWWFNGSSYLTIELVESAVDSLVEKR